MKILILGSEGFVGNNLVKGLSLNNEVITADLMEYSSHENYRFFDATNPSNVEKIVNNVDVVIDLVAHSLVSSIEGPKKNAEVNIIGLINILEACRKNKISKIIFTSASSLIGEPKEFLVSEDHPATPKTAYGVTKLTSEHYLRLYQELYSLNYVIFRFFNIYGPFQKNGLIPSLYSKIKQNQPLTVFGKGDQIRDYVFIEDIIPFFEKSCMSEFVNNKIYNMGTGKGTSIIQVIEHISSIMKIKPQIDFQPPRPGEIGNFVANTEKLNSNFGDIPKTPVVKGLEKTIDWLENNLQ